MNLGKLGRIMLLIGLFGSSLPVLSNSVLGTSQVINRTPAPFTFPNQVPLPTWTSMGSGTVVPPAPQNGTAVVGQHYRYSRNQQPLDIEMQYITGSDNGNGDADGNGDVQRLLQRFTKIPPLSTRTAIIRQHPETGFYSLFTHQQTAYLSACINPQGISTATEEQFQRNRSTNILQPHQILSWLQGHRPFRDKRCLWVLMTLPSTHSTPEETYPVLETAWVDWYRWWQPRFPAS
jgi:cyanosortase A-associated protein